MLENLGPNLLKEFDQILNLFQNQLSDQSMAFGLEDQNPKDKILSEIVTAHSSEQNKQRILEEFSGFGPLGPLLLDNNINEIIINGKDHIFYETQGCMKRLEDSFLSQITFYHIIEKISAEAGITVNVRKPYCEGRWRDFRVFVLRSPLVTTDFQLCMRKQSKQLWTFERLGSLWAPPEAYALLQSFIQDKKNFLIIGPTSAGKTSVLNACLQEIDPYERVISIEDTDEIVLSNAVSTKLLTQKNAESLDLLIDQQDLVKQSLRLRPDRIVMGEVRGPEAKDLLLALATGHRGSIGTLHAKDHKQALWKLETLAQMGAAQWQTSTVQRLIFSSLQALVVLDKKDSVRRLKGLYTNYRLRIFRLFI